MASAVTRAVPELREIVAASRDAQGLPAAIDDSATLARVRAALTAGGVKR